MASQTGPAWDMEIATDEKLYRAWFVADVAGLGTRIYVVRGGKGQSSFEAKTFGDAAVVRIVRSIATEVIECVNNNVLQLPTSNKTNSESWRSCRLLSKCKTSILL